MSNSVQNRFDVKENALTVLIAEDESIIRMDIKDILEEAGITVVGEATNGLEAVKLVKELQPEIVLMDIKMPELDVDGLEAAEQINQLNTSAVVILTAFSQDDFVNRAIDAGVMTYIVKPFNAEDLIPALKLAKAKFEEFKFLNSRIDDLNDKFEVRKLVDKAKGLLMDKHDMTEQEAFSWIQKSAMDKRTTMKNIAEKLIETLES